MLDLMVNLTFLLTPKILNLSIFLTVREILTTMLRPTKQSHQGSGSSGGSAAAGSETLERHEAVEACQIQEWQVPGP